MHTQQHYSTQIFQHSLAEIPANNYHVARYGLFALDAFREKNGGSIPEDYRMFASGGEALSPRCLGSFFFVSFDILAILSRIFFSRKKLREIFRIFFQFLIFMGLGGVLKHVFFYAPQSKSACTRSLRAPGVFFLSFDFLWVQGVISGLFYSMDHSRKMLCFPTFGTTIFFRDRIALQYADS